MNGVRPVPHYMAPFQKKKKRSWIPAIVVGGILLLAAAFFIGELLSRGGQSLPGAFIIYTPSWTAPSGERVSGTILYKPAAGTVSYAVDPSLTSLALVSLSLSDDGKELMGIRTEEGAMTVVRIARENPLHPVVIASAPALAVYAARSPDGALVAYAKLGEDGSAELYVNGAEGGEPASKGRAVPVSFSPDGSAVLAATAEEWRIITLLGGSARAVSGLPALATPPVIQFSPTRSYAFFAEAGKPLRVYHMNWADASATLAEELPIALGSSFGFAARKGKDVLFIADSSRVTEYALFPTGASETASHSVPGFPQDSRILGYLE